MDMISMTTNKVAAVSGLHNDRWYIHRIIAACILAVTFGAYLRILDFWSLSGGVFSQQLRDLFHFPGFLLLFLPAIFSVLIWFISAIIALFRLHFRLVASNIAAIALLYGCLSAILIVPIFDPWFWYVLINKSRFEAAVVANSPTEGGPRFAIVEEWDVSQGISGESFNHLVTLIYDENATADVASSHLDQKHLYGHFYRRDSY